MKEIEQYRDLFINREDAYATQRRGGSYICRKEEVSDKFWSITCRSDSCFW